MIFRMLDTRDGGELRELSTIIDATIERPEFWIAPDDLFRERMLGMLDDGSSWVYGAFGGTELVAVVGMLRDATMAELGPIMCHPRYRNQGIVTELSHMMLARAASAGISTVFSAAHPDNAVSQTVLAKLGFEWTGSMTRDSGYERDVLMLRLA